MTYGSKIANFKHEIAGEFTLHVEQILIRIWSAAIEFHGECLWRYDDCVGRARRSNPVLPRFGRKGRIVVIARASRGIAANIEPWITLVLAVERACRRTDRQA